MEKIGLFTPTELPVCIDVAQIVTMHYFKYSKLFAFAGERHDFWEFAYVDQGEVGAAVDYKGIDLAQGEAVFHKPNEFHSIWAKNSFANVVVLAFVCKSPAMSFFENKIMSFTEEQRGLLAKILDAGKACLRDPLDDVFQTQMHLRDPMPFAGGQVIKNYIELLLISLMQCSEMVSTRSRETQSAKRGYENNIVDSIKQLLQDSVYDHVSIDFILEKICFSKSYLTRIFRDHAGCSIMEYYISLKIAQAQKMISERELSFSQIAEILGFGSIHYFSYMFKKKTHMTPSEYRNSVQSRAVL